MSTMEFPSPAYLDRQRTAIASCIQLHALPPTRLRASCVHTAMLQLHRQPMDTRRLLDLCVGVPALLLSAPLVSVLAVCVRLDSRGSAFFVQQRVGRGRKTFQLYKLRTMIPHASTVGPLVTAAGDPRVTRVGSLLRASKLDELPQLWNVVRGDMSLVGPRPETERYARHYRPEWEQVFSVRPGITSEASIVFRHEESLLSGAPDREAAYIHCVLPEKIGLELAELRTRAPGFWSDMRTILRTIFAVAGTVDASEHPSWLAAHAAIAAYFSPRALREPSQAS